MVTKNGKPKTALLKFETNQKFDFDSTRLTRKKRSTIKEKWLKKCGQLGPYKKINQKRKS